MLKHKNIDRIIIVVLIISVLVMGLLMSGVIPIESYRMNPLYKEKLFKDNVVNEINIQLDDWDNFINDALSETYVPSDITINGELIENVGFRTKGNNSLRLTEKYGHDRFSFKVELDHFYSANYHGLDKFSLDASFQDNAYLKTFLAMDMMRSMGVVTPLVSYVWLTVNEEDWGLYLIVEEPEVSFARRNYGSNFGQLYKPDFKYLDDDNSDVALIYTDDDFASYDNIFRKSIFNISKKDKRRLINSLKVLGTKENLEDVVDIDAMLRYFVVQSFVVNMDSYFGKNGHNYFLHEKDGILSMLPWDYNLAFGTYALGMPNPIKDATKLINQPIFTPVDKDIMVRRPMFHHLMQDKEIFRKYQEYYQLFINDYIDSGYVEAKINEIEAMIAPYVKKDPTRFISYDDHKAGVEAMRKFVSLRAQSVKGQLKGEVPATIRKQRKYPDKLIDADNLKIEDLGEVKDLK